MKTSSESCWTKRMSPKLKCKMATTKVWSNHHNRSATWIHKQGLEKQEYLLSIKCRTCLVLGWLNSFNGEGKSCINITDTSMQPPISAPLVSDRHTPSLLSRANLHEEYLLKGKIAREIADTPICDHILVSQSNYFNIQLMRKLSATTVGFKCRSDSG